MKREVSKSRQPLLRTAIYSFMTLTVAVVVTLLMLIVLGYSFNSKDGRLEQGGLLQFISNPTGATVTLDEVQLGPRTNSKTTVTSGSHTVSYDREGYRTWNKTIQVNPGQIGWLSYARLIPNNIQAQSLREFTTLAGTLASPQRNYILLQESASQPVFALVDVRGDTLKYQDLALPSGILTANTKGKAESFAIASWSNDERAVLIKHTYDGKKTEWLLLDRESPDESININATFGIVPDELEFAGGNYRLMFVQTKDIVRRINLDEQTLSRPLASKVAYFTGYDDKTIVYTTVTDEKKQRTVGYASVDIAKPVTISSYTEGKQPLLADMGSYFNRRYVAILHGQQLSILVGDLPTLTNKGSLKTFATQTIPAGAVDLTMSRNNRFVVAQMPDGYATYDIELKKYDKTKWDIQPKIKRELQWLDDYMLWSDAGGQLRFYEFDGANQNNIMPVVEGFSASISPNDKFIYGIGKTDKGLELKRAQLLL